MEIDVLYVAYNRLEYTRQSFASVLANTNWDLVRRLVVHDDGSTDGTLDYLMDATWQAPVAAEIATERVGGPVAVMNHYLARSDRAELLAKVDNDFVMCPGWLDALAAVLHANPALDIVGTEPGILLDVPAEGRPGMVLEPAKPGGPCESAGCGGTLHPYRYRPCEHIGGKGLMRTRAFDGRPMTPSGKNGYFGFTEWQVRHPEVREGWIDPDLHCFGLDQVPLEPWAELNNRYVKAGWGRYWPKYSWDAEQYWAWWTPVTA